MCARGISLEIVAIYYVNVTACALTMFMRFSVTYPVRRITSRRKGRLSSLNEHSEAYNWHWSVVNNIISSKNNKRASHFRTFFFFWAVALVARFGSFIFECAGNASNRLVRARALIYLHITHLMCMYSSTVWCLCERFVNLSVAINHNICDTLVFSSVQYMPRCMLRATDTKYTECFQHKHM